MSNENKDKITPEEAPPLGKRSMVSEKDLEERIQKLSESTDSMSARDTLLLFAVEKLHDVAVQLKRIADVFEGTKKGTDQIIPLKKKETAPVAPEVPSQPIAGPATSRTAEIVQAFESVKELVVIDTEESAQFVKVYMSGFLGKESFNRVKDVAKGLGSEYVSQGKKSHFKIPKMGKQAKLDTPKKPQKTGNPIEDIRMMFPEDLENILRFEEKDDYIQISPRQFLGSENFAKIASVIRSLNGDYVSAGKASHFRVPKK